MGPDSGPPRPSHLSRAIDVSFPTTHTHTHTFQTLKATPPHPRPRHPNKSSIWLPEARKTERQTRRQRRDAGGGEVIREDFLQEVPPGSGRRLLP